MTEEPRPYRWKSDVQRGRSIARALKVLFKLQAGGRHTLASLAREHRVTPRTIRRDIYALEEAGVPIVHEDFDCAWSVVLNWTFRRAS